MSAFVDLEHIYSSMEYICDFHQIALPPNLLLFVKTLHLISCFSHPLDNKLLHISLSNLQESHLVLFIFPS